MARGETALQRFSTNSSKPSEDEKTFLPIFDNQLIKKPLPGSVVAIYTDIDKN